MSPRRSVACAWLVLTLGACGGTVTPPSGTGTPDASSPDAALGDAPSSDGATPQFGACNGPGQCVLATPRCCEGCGVPALTDFQAIHRDQSDAFRAYTCTEPNPVCPGCASQPNPNLVAVCRSATCTGVDVRADAWSACEQDSDCVLRAGSACCEACAAGGYDLIAIRASQRAALAQELCAPSTGCPECAPIYPPEAQAVCDAATKHCKVTSN